MFKTILLGLTTLSLALAFNAQGAPKKHEAFTLDELKWQPSPEHPKEVQMAVISGNPMKGAHTAYHKFSPGFTAPDHTHTATLKTVVVAGPIVTGAPGKEKSLPAGSYYILPGGWVHTTKCDSDDSCVIFVEANGKFDVRPTGAKKSK